MALRFLAVALATNLLLPAWPTRPAEAQTDITPAKLVVPITGSVARGGTFVGTLSLQEFAVRGDQLVAVGMISGAVSGNRKQRRTGLQGPVELPVTLKQVGAEGSPAIRNQRGTDRWLDRPIISYVQQQCEILRIEIGGATLTLLGLTVALDPVVLDISGDSGGLLGNTVCQILGLLNSAVGLVVGLLNQLLGLLGGLTGGLAGGVPA
jgi:hypothetical protein